MKYAKSVLAGLIAGCSAAIPMVDDGLTASEGLGIVLAFLTGLGIVYAVPNKPVATDERGATDVVQALLVVFLVVVILVVLTWLIR